ncbi:MAG: hypothetical protein AAB692_05680, partial [Patescibacteria group bacterium]
MSRLRLAVIYGGRSGEHDVSLMSAAAVMAALAAQLAASDPHSAALLLALTAALSAGLQFLYGSLRCGRLIKY